MSEQTFDEIFDEGECPEGDNYIRKAVVTKISDGDTMHFMVSLGFDAYHKAIVRVLDLDTPEKYGRVSAEERERGHAATARANELLPIGSEVLIETRQNKRAKGKYGRWLAKIWLPCGRRYAAIMTEEGHVK